jgi:hypothetical protein
LVEILVEELCKVPETDMTLFYGAKSSVCFCVLALEQIFLLCFENYASRIVPYQDPNFTNVYEFCSLVIDSAAANQLPQIVLHAVGKLFGNPRRDRLIPCILCAFCNSGCGENVKARVTLTRLFLTEVLGGGSSSGGVLGAARSDLKKSGSRVMSMLSPRKNSSGSLPPATVGRKEVVVTGQWEKTSEKVTIGKQRPCTECNETYSEAHGAMYRFTSLGETKKRFVCSKCIEIVKERIKNLELANKEKHMVKNLNNAGQETSTIDSNETIVIVSNSDGGGRGLRELGAGGRGSRASAIIDENVEDILDGIFDSE